MQNASPRDGKEMNGKGSFFVELGTLIVAVVTMLFSIFTYGNTSGLEEKKQTNERFLASLERLGSDSMAVRMGAMYILEGVNKEKDSDRKAAVEIMSAFIRYHQPRKTRDNKEAECSSLTRPKTDVQTAATILGRRNTRGENFGVGEQPELHDTALTRIDLHKAQLDKADFTDSDLRCARFVDAHLREAVLIGAFLQRANFSDADLTGAKLKHARLSGAIWRNTTCPDGANSDTVSNTCETHLSAH
ncbi:pentapeptide repeat-containing protein [Streptomyces chartreusis]|uniref:pentapeptide repeat-containing protein n=1 Tax=Streptomyces chartreusis TaxID=1969 RepID=UPI003693F14B